MNKQELIKLAEIAGYDAYSHSVDGTICIPFRPRMNEGIVWRPHEDVAQAFEVLEGWQEDEDYIVQHFKLNGVYICQLASPCRIPLPITMGNTASGASHALAICKAVLKAEGGKDE
jgi:hypothetical protein